MPVSCKLRGGEYIVTDANGKVHGRHGQNKTKCEAQARAINMKTESMKVPASLTIPMACQIKAQKGDGPPKFRMVANTGQPMHVNGFADPVVIDLKGAKFRQNIPVVEDHDLSARIGHTTRIRRTAEGELVVNGVMSATGAKAREVQDDAANGFPFQASVGADIQGQPTFVDEGEETEVNGQIMAGPLLVARKTSIYEVTVTALGADPDTSFSLQASRRGDKTTGVVSMTIEAKLKELGLQPDGLDESQLEAFTKLYGDVESSQKKASDLEARLKASAGLADEDGDDDDDDDDDDDAAIKARRRKLLREADAEEEDRLEGIRAAFKNPDFGSLSVEAKAKIRKKANDNDWSVERLELELYRQARPKPGELGGVAIHDAAKNKGNAMAIEASMCIMHGKMKQEAVAKSIPAKHREDVMELALSADYRGYTLHRLCHEVIRAAGMHCRIGQYDNAFIRTMKRADLDLQAAGDFSTVTVTGILSNIQNKILLNAFQSTDQALFSISAEGSVSDFKTMTGYRMTGIGEFTMVSPAGEIGHMSLGEESYTIKADTYGAIISLNRQQIINDDLGAFAQVPRAIGRASKMKLHDVAYNELLDNATFFTGPRNNYLQGAQYTFGIEALTNAVTLFMRQMDINNKPIDMMPAILLGGTADATEMDKVFAEANILVRDHDTASSASREVPNRNPHAGKYQPNNTRWLDSNVSTGGNGADDHWFLLNDNPDTACLEIRYLNGVSSPTIEQQETAPDVLGLQWVGYFDFGVAKKEHRGGVYVAPSGAPRP